MQKNTLYNQSRTLGISKSNIDYLNNEITNIDNVSWKIQNIKIFTEKTAKKNYLNLIIKIMKFFNSSKLQITKIVT